jgi:hypothetical protein
MYVFPASQFKVHAANEPGLAREQSALSGILISQSQGVALVLSNSGVVENAHVMSKSRGASSVKNRGNRICIECLQKCSSASHCN